MISLQETSKPLSAEAQQAAAKAEYAHKSKIGGQALIEGVMMKGAFRGAMACRLPNGEIDIETWDLPASFETDPKTGKQRVVRKWYNRIPLVRGCVNFVMSMIDGYRCMMKAAEKQYDEEVDDYCAWRKHEKIDKLPESEAYEKFAEWLKAEREKIDAEKAKEDKNYQPLGAPDAETVRKRWEYLKKASENYDYEEPSKLEQWLDDKLGDKAKSKETLEQGMIKFPQNQGIVIGLINYYMSTNEDMEKLYSLLAEAKANDPKNASLYYVEGNIRKQAGDKEKAVELYRQSVNANPDAPYDYGYIGEGILYYEEAMEYAEKAQNELDDNKYFALVKEYEASLQKALPPFEQAYNVCKDPGLRVEIAKYLRDINYRFREQDPKYQAAYDRFDAVVKSGQPD